jgi:1,2-diacylglycerol 3-alpha-glucosyltransferase
MKIGLFTDTYAPQVNGVATSVGTLKEQLEVLGHDVYVFTTSDPMVASKEDRIKRIPSVPVVAGRRLAFAAFGATGIIRELHFDLIHTHTEFTMGHFGRRLARKSGIPFIHTMHTVYENYTHYIPGAQMVDPLAKNMARRLCAAFCNSADMVVVPTAKVESLVYSYGVSRHVSVIPTGVELNRFNACGKSDTSAADATKVSRLRAQLGLAKRHKVIVSVGRLSAEKGVDEVLRMMKTYLPVRPDVRLLIVGDGPARCALEALAVRLGIGDRVIFAGEQPWGRIADFYRLGQVFISASQSEAQGLTYLEALAAGVPVIAKADTCLNDVLTHGINGWIFKDEASMVFGLDSLLFDEAHRERASLQAVLSARRFSAEQFGKAMQDLYFMIARLTNVPHRRIP